MPKPPASDFRDLASVPPYSLGIKKKYQIDGVFYYFLNYFKIIVSINNTCDIVLNSQAIQKFIF